MRFLHKLLIGLFLLFLLSLVSLYFFTPDENRLYIKPLRDPIETLDPTHARTRADYMLAKNIFGQMLELNEFGEVTPSAIDSWSISDDGTVYTFKINENIYFHSGKHLDIHDIVFTFHFLSRPTSLVSGFFHNIEGYDDYIKSNTPKISGIQILKKNLLKIKLKKPSYLFLVNLADPKIVVLPNLLNNVPEEKFFKNPDGIGPYKMEELSPDKLEVVLVANENYFRGKPKIKEYRFLTMSKEKAIKMFKENNVHDLELFYLTENEMLQFKERANIFSTSAFSTGIIFLNLKKDIFKKESVRKLLSSAIDISTLKEECHFTVVRNRGFIPYGVMGWIGKNTIEINEAEKQEAKAILSKIEKPLVFFDYGFENSACLVNSIRKQLESKLHIPIQSLHIDQKTAIETFSEGKYDFFFDHISARGREPFHLLTFFDPKSPHNLTKVEDNTIAEKIDNLIGIKQRNIRAEKYQEINKYISQDMAYIIPVYSDIRQYVFNKNVKSHSIPATILGNLGLDKIWF